MKAREGKILRVDLTVKNMGFENFDDYTQWLGGQGVNQFILFNELPVGISPYDPSNILAIGTGVLVGTNAPGASRTNIDTLNAFTGGIGSGNAGGNFARALRFAGINNIIIKGKADDLKYLYVDDQSVELRDASHLRGKRVSEAAKILHKEIGDDFSLLLIGPAGENLVRGSCIILDEARSASRSGLGAVMGSKNLKAIAVKGTGSVQPVDPAGFESAIKVCLNKLNSHPYIKGLRTFGVYWKEPYIFGIESPYRNFSGLAIKAEQKKKVCPEAFLPYMVGTKTCGTCPAHCWKAYKVSQDGHTVNCQALQVNAICNFAARFDLFDPRTVLKAHALCNDLGLDQDNACGVIAWAFDCYDHGLINKHDTGGLDLCWGNEEAFFRLLEDTAYRRGFGDLLAEGCKRASQSLPGTEDLCIHIKGQELYETIWTSPAWALGTVVAARGGTHTRGAVRSERVKNISADLCRRLFGIDSVAAVTSYENAERLVGFFEQLQALSNSLGVCYFMHGLSAADLLLPEDYARLYSAATGESVDTERMMWVGERIFNLEKCFNVLHTNWTRTDDMPPKRFTDRPLDGRYKIDHNEWDAMLTRYYKLHGWDHLTGRPLAQTLDRLDLGLVKKRLEQEGKHTP